MPKKIGTKKYKKLAEHYERCFDQHGDTHKGVDWPNENDANLRYQIMWEFISYKQNPSTLLDVGCGTGHFLEYLIKSNNIQFVEYTGLDISPMFIDFCKVKHPEYNWILKDLLMDDLRINYDFVSMNGLFTEKLNLTFDEMELFWQNMMPKVFSLAKTGIIFNVMSAHVDWQRDDLFHLPMDRMAVFIKNNLSRHFTIRHDYGLYEYTVCVYKNPTR